MTGWELARLPTRPARMRQVLVLVALPILLTACPALFDPACDGVTLEACRQSADLVLSSISQDERSRAEVLAVRPTQSSICNDDDAPLVDVEVRFLGNPERSVITVGRNTRDRLLICTY